MKLALRIAVVALLAAPGVSQVALNQETKLNASDAAPDDAFGSALALRGDRALVGAPDNVLQAGAAGGPGQGAVYVFEWTPDHGWQETFRLVASDGEQLDRLGRAVCLGDDLAFAAAEGADVGGVEGAGKVYVFEPDPTRPGAWLETQQLSGAPIGGGDGFGHSLAYDDGTLVVGSWQGSQESAALAGAVDVFELQNGTWTSVQRLSSPAPASGAQFGATVQVEADTLVVGEPREGPLNQGKVHVFTRSGGGPFTLQASLSPEALPANAHFGLELELSGNTLAAARDDGRVHVFERDAQGTWSPTATLTGASSVFGDSLALQGDALAVYDSPPAGKEVVLLERPTHTSGPWVPTARLRPKGYALTGFGADLALDGDRLLAGDPMGHQGEGFDFGDVRGLATDPVSGRVYGIDPFGLLLDIDPSTGLASVIGSAGPPFAYEALAFESSSGKLLASSSQQLVEIDPQTAASSVRGSMGIHVLGLAEDLASGVLYGLTSSGLVTISQSDGQVTAVGSANLIGIESLAYAPNTSRLYCASGNFLYWIAKSTGALTLIGSVNGLDLQALTADPLSAALLGADASADELLKLNKNTAAATPIGSFSQLEVAGCGTVHEFDLEHDFATYCTAGTSAGGCMAAMGALGYPSATAAQGFQLLAAGVEGQRTGLFLFGTSGRQANPWGNGTSYQCVAPPVKRGSALSSGGSAGACDGSFAQDLNARWCASCPKPAQNPGAGALVQAQFWYRDPGSTSNQPTSLSDALEFTVLP